MRDLTPGGRRGVDELSPYDRATVGLWRRSYHRLERQPEDRSLAEAAMHAVLAGLRRWTDPPALFAAYEAGTAADFSMIDSLLPSTFPEELRWTVREAAFYLRWRELTSHGE
jgi:hypothetical protein